MIKRLDWDSACFGYEVGMVRVEDVFDLQRFVEDSVAYQLVYIFSRKNIGLLPPNTRKVDQKITLGTTLSPFDNNVQMGHNTQVKKICGLDLMNNKSIDTQVPDFKKDFIDLALDSGEYSRFKVDRRLINKEYEKLYYAWAEKALTGIDEGLVSLHEGRVNGMIMYASSGNGTVKVELLAVSRNCRHRGIGSLLINLVRSEAGEKGAKAIQVTTQHANKTAIAFYLKKGFEVIDEQNVYHWWKG